MIKESTSSHFVINGNAKIEEAMESITLNKRGAVLVVDEKGKLIGVASDGDIRRALVRGMNVMAPISKAMNPHVLFIKKNSSDDKAPEKFFKSNRKITILPVVNTNFVLSHLYHFPDAKT